METTRIGTTDLLSTRLGYGCMRIAGTWNPAEITPERREHAHRCLIAAYEAGYTLFDHADIYCRGACESLHGEVLKQIPSMRDEIIIATKGGIRFAEDPAGTVGRYDFSYKHLVEACEGSLKRLGIETIDIYQLHRPDVLMHPEEVCRAFTELQKAGKVRYFGVSNFFPWQVSVLQKALPMKLVVNQIEVSLVKREPFFDGTLDQCMQEGLTPLSWSPIAPVKDSEAWPRLQPLFQNFTEDLRVDWSWIALAWLLRHPSGIVPIVGSANPERIRNLTSVTDFTMNRETWYEFLTAAQGHRMA